MVAIRARNRALGPRRTTDRESWITRMPSPAIRESAHEPGLYFVQPEPGTTLQSIGTTEWKVGWWVASHCTPARTATAPPPRPSAPLPPNSLQRARRWGGATPCTRCWATAHFPACAWPPTGPLGSRSRSSASPTCCTRPSRPSACCERLPSSAGPPTPTSSPSRTPLCGPRPRGR